MSTTAKVESIDSIKEFRVFMAKFKEAAEQAISEADSDLVKTETWLEGEAQNYWSGQIRKRQEVLSRAEEALRQKRVFKDSSGSTPSAVDEQKAVNIAKQRLNEAQTKLSNVKQWIRRLQKEMVLYKGGVARFANDISAGVPQAIAHLGSTIEMLEKYVGIGMAPAGADGGEMAGAGAGAFESGGATMARGTETAPKESGKADEAGDAPIDANGLRDKFPTPKVSADATFLEWKKFAPISAVLADEKRGVLLALSAGAVDASAAVLVEASAIGARRVYVSHLSEKAAEKSAFSWFLGTVDGSGETVYNRIQVGDVIKSREDWTELFQLPAGFLAVLDDKGIVAIYNHNNENVLP